MSGNAWKCLLCAIIIASAGPAFADDHGNNCPSATPMDYSWATGEIETAGDRDYFEIELTHPGDVTLMSSSPQVGADFFGTLLDSSCHVIETDDDSGEGYHFLIERHLTAGTYYVEVRHYSASSYNWEYDLNYFYYADADDHGGSGSPTTVSVPSTTAAEFEYAGDADCFRVQPATTGTLTAFTTGMSNTFGYLFDGSSIAIQDNDSGIASNFMLSYPVLAGSTYIVCVEEYDDDVGDYSIGFTFTTGDDHGDVCGTASVVNLYSGTNGVIGAPGDRDVFSFYVPSQRWVTIETSGVTDTFGTLRNSSCGVITTQDDISPTERNFRISRLLSAGTYYIEVRHYYSTLTGAFRLLMNPIY